MNHNSSRVTRVDELVMEANAINLRRKGKSLPNGESSSSIRGEEEVPEGQASPTWSSLSGDEYRVSVPAVIPHYDEDELSSNPSSLNREENPVPQPTESLLMKELQHDNSHVVDEGLLQASLTLIRRNLKAYAAARNREGQRQSLSSTCIFQFPHSLIGVDQKAYQPELVSIGPYHRGKDHLLEFEEHKWFFLHKFLSRSSIDLAFYLREVRVSERIARECYSEMVPVSSHDFVEMVLLDSCFILELLRHLNHSGDVIEEDDPIFTRPWLIPILIRDLLKLENQLPYFLIRSMFNSSGRNTDIKTRADHLPILALKAFDLAFPTHVDTLNQFRDWNGNHLLDLFHSSLLPRNQVITCNDLEGYRPSNQSIQSVTELRPAGIKFKPRKCDSFLDINFQNQVLEIPSITINDFTSTVLINCVALEQCKENRSKYFTDYVSFMSCLINQPRDVTFLCSDGIITRFSQDDQYVANLFNNLGKNVAFNIRDSYLSKLFREVESYYSSNWATMRRTYFSSPWSLISVLSASVLLVLTMVQTVMSVLSYKSH